MKIILKQNEPNPIKDDARYNQSGVKELVQHQGHTYRVLNYVRHLTPCECFIRGLAWALSCITIIPIIFCRASVSRLLNEARTKSVRKIVYTPIDLQRKFDKLKEHIRNIRFKPDFIDELVGQDLSLENYSNLKKWLVARDTLVVWTVIAREAEIQEGDLGVCGFLDVETTVERASKFGEWCVQNTNEIAKIKALRLQYCSLTHLPKEIGNLSQLTHLNLDHNQLRHLPREVGKLSQLTHLNLDHNQLRHLPREVGKLSQLKYLVLGKNQLTHLPKEIGDLSQLTYLNLSDNQLTDLPEEVGKLSQLTELILYNNQLTHLPGTFGNLSKLTLVVLGNNQLTQLPEEVGNLSQLTHIGLSHNQLTYLPKEISNLSQLKHLYLAGNPLSGTSQEVANLAKLGCSIHW